VDHQQAITMHAVERYLLNELTDSDRDAFEDHYFTCAICAQDIRAGALMRDGARAGMTIDTPVARQTADVIPLERSRRWRAPVNVILPWAVAATLAVVAGYQSLWVVPGLREQAVPLVTAPVLLRPASRGAITTVELPRSGVVAFALDFNRASVASPLSYDLRTIDGQPVAAGVVAAPPAGTPLLLVVPAASLAPGNYLVTVKESGQTDAPIAEYRFAVTKAGT
jgi:hypothetical protein